MKLRAAGAQIAVTREIPRNEDNISRAIEWAAREGADLLLTPEGSLSGYYHEFDRRAVAAALGRVTELARNNRIGLALGTCFEEPDGLCYNQARIYDESGEFLGFHSKILRTSSLKKPYTGETTHYAESPLRTFELKGVAVGALICNDLWANPGCTPEPDPHLTQQLSNMGARVILHAVNGGRKGNEKSKLIWQFHESNLRMRAMAGRIWVVTADSCHPETIPCSAPSGVIRPDGNWAVQARMQGEDFFLFEIDIPEEGAVAGPDVTAGVATTAGKR